MDTYNVRFIEITPEDLRKAAANGGLTIPLSPDTRSVVVRGIVQAREEPEPPKSA